MQWVTPVVMMLAWLSTVESPKTLAIKREISRLQGTWTVVEVTVDGDKVPPEDESSMEYVFRGQELLIRGEEFLEEAVFQVNGEASPKTIDLANAKQPGPMTSG